MGLACYDKYSSNYREYIAVKLNNTLEQNRTYCFSLRTSLGDSLTYPCNNISVGFFYDTSKFIDLNFSTNKTLSPDSYYNLTKEIVTDKTNWLLLNIKFRATGSENYLVIGNFNSDNYTDTIKLNNGNNLAGFEGAYYYFDSINLNECNNLQSQFTNFEYNLITDNNDGYNDFFNFSELEVTHFKFQVYNRWGNLVYETKDKNTKWYGQNQNNTPLPTGTYYYLIEANDVDGTYVHKHNFVQVLY